MINSKRLFLGITILICFNSFANCLIPGWPGCSAQDFQNALQAQQQLQLQQQQLRELQQANELTRQLLEQQKQQHLQNFIWQEPKIVIDPIWVHQQRCLTMPLGTRGC